MAWIRMAILSVMSLWAPVVMSADYGAIEDYQVIESNLPQYAVGSMLKEKEVPDPAALPKGGYIRVLRQSRTTLIENPKPDRDVGGARDLPLQREQQPR